MAFSTGNDINILQATDAAVVGAGAGDDVYLINGSSLAANQSITISDVEGSNIIKLIGGVTIASNIVAESAAQLTLSNGAVINILAANTFSYELAGDPFSAGTGTIQNYNNFATQTLGVSTLPTGATTTNGHTNIVINSNGSVSSDETGSTTTQGSEFSIVANSILEGGSGTSDLIVTVNRTGDTTAAASVNVSTADNTATAGIDYVGISNEVINFTAGQSSATFTVTINGDDTAEADEIFTATLSNASSGSSINENAATVNLTILNDDGNATFTLTRELLAEELELTGLNNSEYGIDWIV